MTRTSFIFLALVTALASGCKTKPDSPPDEPTAIASGPVAAVESIVFIDMRKACDCTTKRTRGSWAKLMKATEGLDIPIQRIHMDEDDEEASRYSDMKPYVAIPAVYFLDGEGDLVGMLQGEITQSQFENVISGATPSSPPAR